jgi:hypothetical protein
LGKGQGRLQISGTFLTLFPGHLANATTDLMKLDHEEEPQLSEPYLSKQKKLMVSGSSPTLLSEEQLGKLVLRGSDDGLT